MLNAKVNTESHQLLEKSDIFDLIYPVGSVYFCTSSTACPLATYGGTWTLADFEIVSNNNNNYGLDIDGGTMANGQNVQIYNLSKSLAQRWLLKANKFKSSTELGYCFAWLRTA